MKVSELDYAEQFHVFNFLKRLANMVNGDVRKKVQFRRVWMEIEGSGTNFPITEIAFKNSILPMLVQEKLVGWDKKDELNITYEGYIGFQNTIWYLQKPSGFYQGMIWKSIRSHF